jgi:hypothetical protein
MSVNEARADAAAPQKKKMNATAPTIPRPFIVRLIENVMRNTRS